MIALLVAFVLTATPVATAAEAPDVTTIVKQMKEVLEPARPSTRKVVISVSPQRGEKTQWVAGQALKKFPDGKRMVTVILEPEGLKGNALLVQERQDKPTTMWIYSAALRRIRQLVPVDIYQHFLDTDFTYADLGFVGLQGTYRLLGEEERAGVRTYKIEEGVPRERAYYSRIITWVAVDSMIPLQRDYYDVAGTLWKTEVFDNVVTTDGVPTPLHIKMEDVQERSTTELKLEQVRYDADIPDTLFDPTQLPRVAELPLWQAYLSPAAGKP